MRRTWMLAAAGGLAAIAVAAAGCGDDDSDGALGHMDDGGHMSAMAEPPAGAIRVGLRNWAVEPAVTSVPAGKVTFWAVHEMDHAHGHDEGGQTHDLQVMQKTPSGGMKLVGQVQGLRMGEAAALALELEPGEYELSCNVVEEVGGRTISHYKEGMVTTFTVTG